MNEEIRKLLNAEGFITALMSLLTRGVTVRILGLRVYSISGQRVRDTLAKDVPSLKPLLDAVARSAQ